MPEPAEETNSLVPSNMGPDENAEVEQRSSERASVAVPQPGDLPDDLPPVQPPSAGFIIQLFLIPGLIVLAVVGVWALFGKMSASEQDWGQLVRELGSSNPHRRWRGALGLAQMLKADESRGEAGQHLGTNSDIAKALTELLEQQLGHSSKSEDDLKQQAFLARSLGMLDVPEVVLPTLQKAMQPGQDRELRKNAIASIALIAGRAAARGHSLDGTPVVDNLIDISTDPDPFVRQLATYTLGLIPSLVAKQRLEVLLENADVNTRVNAALGLSRHRSTKGFDVFKAVLADSMQPIEEDSIPAETTEERRRNVTAKEFERTVALKNALKAISDLAKEFDAEQRRTLVKLTQPIVQNHPDSRIRIDAEQAQKLLSGD